MNFIDGLVRAYHLAQPQYKAMLLQDLYDNHLKTSDEYYGSSVAYVELLKERGQL
jgi:hypothetical protein